MTVQGRIHASARVMIQGSEDQPYTNTAVSASQALATPRTKSLMDCATATADVSAFCRATLSRLIPSELWGTGEAGQANMKVIMRHVDRFIHARRFESLSLHAASEGLKVCIRNMDAQRFNVT